MAILNATPDSFYDGGREDVLSYGLKLIDEGADILDIGGESTRPGAPEVPEEEELRRVIPLIEALRDKSEIPLSIDTRKAKVAKAAIAAGATLVNDVSGFRDPEMREVAAESGADLCVMHMLETPKTMQNQPEYPEGIIEHLLHFFEGRIQELQQAGVKRDKIILDPGIGFGKTVEHNLKIIHNLPRLKALGFPLLLGASRKSFMGKILARVPHRISRQGGQDVMTDLLQNAREHCQFDKARAFGGEDGVTGCPDCPRDWEESWQRLPAAELLPATIAVNTMAVVSGAVEYIRVHDVKEHRQVLDFLQVRAGAYLSKK